MKNLQFTYYIYIYIIYILFTYLPLPFSSTKYICEEINRICDKASNMHEKYQKVLKSNEKPIVYFKHTAFNFK